MNRRWVFVAGGIVAVLLIVGTILAFSTGSEDTNPSENQQEPAAETRRAKDQGFVAEAVHQGGTEWTYRITGELPNPCYSFEDEWVAATEPEEVMLSLTVTPPEPDEVCAQQIQEVEATGSFPASTETKFSFEVEGIER